MATGITKNAWDGSTHVISSEYFPYDTSYELTYKGKSSEDEILKGSVSEKYESIYGKHTDNKLFYGDNLDVLRFLLKSSNLTNKLKLIYIDPPYGTNSIFQSRDQKDSYRDDLIGSHFIEFIRKRLVLLRELLSNDGSIYVHLDGNMIAPIKVIMDEIFGSKNFRGFITRKNVAIKISQEIHTETFLIIYYFILKLIILYGIGLL